MSTRGSGANARAMSSFTASSSRTVVTRRVSRARVPRPRRPAETARGTSSFIGARASSRATQTPSRARDGCVATRASVVVADDAQDDAFADENGANAVEEDASATVLAPNADADADAASDENEAETDEDTANASVRDLMKFTLPTMAIWLCEPLLSLVDTSVVGLSSSTIELAAIAPGSVYAGYPAYLLATGFAVATTSMVGQDRLLARRGGLVDEDERTVASAIATAVFVASVSAALLILVHKPALTAYIGPANVELLPYAFIYSVIRILALPVAIVTAVSQAAFLAVQDPWTPLRAVSLTTVLNLVLDVWFVCGLGWGIAGAAGATSLSQVITMSLLIRALVKRGPEIDKVRAMVAEATERAKLSSFAENKSRAVMNIGAPALRLPFKRPRDGFLSRLISISGPVMMVAAIKCVFVGWVVRAGTSISPEASAANGVLLTVYFFFAVIGEGVSQAAQAFLPPQLGNFKKAKELAFRIMLVAVVVGFFNAIASGLLPSLFPQLFTKSEAVIELMNEAIPFMSLALFAHTGSMASEGCLLAARDGVFMSLSYIPNSILSCITLTILSARGFGVQSSWIALFQFHVFRLIINAVRLRMGSSPLKKSLSRLEEQTPRGVDVDLALNPSTAA